MMHYTGRARHFGNPNRCCSGLSGNLTRKDSLCPWSFGESVHVAERGVRSSFVVHQVSIICGVQITMSQKAGKA